VITGKRFRCSSREGGIATSNGNSNGNDDGSNHTENMNKLWLCSYYYHYFLPLLLFFPLLFMQIRRRKTLADGNFPISKLIVFVVSAEKLEG